MKWDDLKLFLDVSRRPRLEEAAAYAKVDPTTLSRRIKQLEKELGDTLFERTRRGHKLTAAGERLAVQVERIESITSDILVGSAGQNVLSGSVRIGAPEGLGTTIIAPALGSFRRSHPQIDVDLIALSGFVSVPRRQADMSILLTRPTAGRLKVRKLADYSLYLYASEEYLRNNAMIEVAVDLKKHVLIGYSGDLIYSSQLRYLDEVLPGLSPQLCSPSIVAQAHMIAAGAGLGILPTFLANKHPQLRRVLEPEIRVDRTFWLAIHEDVASLARIRAVRDFLVDLKLET